MSTFGIHAFGIGSHHIAHDVTHDVQQTVVGIHSVGKVLWSIVVHVLVGKVQFFQFHYAMHERTILKFKLYFLYVAIKVCHNSYLLFSL